ncbi:MAG: hypothetical protein ACJAUP_002184 [Cellvibrionaceae bacterium]|jgi:hypothetical protein
MTIFLVKAGSHWLLLCVLFIIGGHTSHVFAGPETIAAKMSNIVKGTEQEVSEIVDGFYMVKSRGYYSYLYVTVSQDRYKGVYTYKEAGETNSGYFFGDYNAEEGWGVGKICYEDTNEWLAHGGIIFTQKGDALILRLLYTETNKPRDKRWKNDWGHRKNETSGKLVEYKDRYEKANIDCSE